MKEKMHQHLCNWYQENKRDLPWRKTTNPYYIWVSEVMLQQTQVEKVIPYYNNFIKKFPDMTALAHAESSEVLKSWEGLGYYARIRNFHKAVKIVGDEFDGHIPQEWDVFHSLPGVGNYICAAVLSFGFNLPFAVVDGNVKRVLARLFENETPVNSASAHQIFQPLADKIFNAKYPATHNQAIMELGALICKPANPSCQVCPISFYCLGFQNNSFKAFPKRNKKKPTPLYLIVVGLIYKEDKFLIVQRNTKGLLGGLWEFPGGRIVPDTDIKQGLNKKIKEKTNLDVSVHQKLAEVKHAFTHFKIHLHVYVCQPLSREIKLSAHTYFRWITTDELDDFAFSKASHKWFHILKSEY